MPGAPTGLQATASGTTQINLSWTAPANTGGRPITGYRIEESPNGNSSWTTLEANTNSTNTTYPRTGLSGGTTRHYRVSAINSNGVGAPSNVDDATTGTSVPDAPTSLTATASGTTRINLSWTAPGSDGGSPITGYRIEESPDGNSSWTTLETDTTSTRTTYPHTGLSGGTTRHYRVSAINSNGAGAPSNVDGATTGTTVPDAPTVLTATASGTTRINLSWTAPASDGGSPITGYRIESSPNGNSSWTVLVATTGGASTTHSDTGLPGGATRHYRVSAINSNGAGLPSNVAGTTTGTSVPGAPTALTATASGTARINLSWTAPARDGGTSITGYRIEESPDGTSSWTDLVTDTTNTRTTYSHAGLSGGTTRHYRVSAINSNGAGAPSSVDSATTGTSVPGAPTALSARASGTTQVDLSWTAPASDGGSPVTGYRIEESPNGRSSWTVLVATTGSPATTYSRTGLPSGATRHYRVSAVNTNGAGAPSNTASTTTGTTVPGAPTSLTAAASGTARIDLSWTAPASDGGIRITGYRIESSLGSGSSWTVLVADTGNTRTTYSDTGLSGGTTRYYRVSAINTNGTGAPSNVDGATTDTTVPDAPTDLTARVSENTRINLSWARPASDGGSPVTGYRIEISSDGGSSWTDLVANTRSPHRAYSHTVNAGATRHYRVSAISAIGTSAHSNVASATTVLRRVRFEADLYTAREGGAAATVAVVLSAAGAGAGDDPADEGAPQRRDGGGLLGRAGRRDVRGRAGAANVHGDGNRGLGRGRSQATAAAVRDAAERVRVGPSPHGGREAGRQRRGPRGGLRHGAPHHRPGARARGCAPSVQCVPAHESVRTAEQQSAAAADDPAGGDARGRRGGGCGLHAAHPGERDVRGGPERGVLLHPRDTGRGERVRRRPADRLRAAPVGRGPGRMGAVRNDRVRGPGPARVHGAVRGRGVHGHGGRRPRPGVDPSERAGENRAARGAAVGAARRRRHGRGLLRHSGARDVRCGRADADDHRDGDERHGRRRRRERDAVARQ